MMGGISVKNTLYIRKSKDDYELIEDMAETAVELARKYNIKPEAIYSSISHEKAGFCRSRYEKVVFDD